MLLPNTNCEIYIEPQLDTVYAPGQTVGYLVDYSGKNRTLVADSNYPFYQAAFLNGKAAVGWLGAQNPLKNSAVFQVHCGWIVAKYSGSTFGDYNGLLSDLDTLGVLVGNGGGSTKFYDFGTEFYEYRAADRIYPADNSPAPMNTFRVIFFRFWKPATFNGIQLGRDRLDATRKWTGSVALLALYSRNFYESDIRKYSKTIADNFALTLADVYPYQADKNIPLQSKQSVNFYDPPEGDRISEVLSSSKQLLDLKFNTRPQSEVDAMIQYHQSHYAPALPCIYRNYDFIVPRDVEGYINSPYQVEGAINNFSYGFSFKER